MEAEIAELRERVAHLEARADICELATAYAVACDTHDMPSLMALFAPDAQFASPSGLMVAEGREAIHDMFVELFKVRGPAFHWTHDVCVNVQSADRATGVVYSHAETTPHRTVSLAAMRYNDEYVRSDERWQFARREISFLYYVPASEYTSGLNSAQRLTFGDRRIEADYPENLQAWRNFEARFTAR